MDAGLILEGELAAFRGESYAHLVQRIHGEPINHDTTAPDGTIYQIEIECMWEYRPGGNVLVTGSIDDGGWRAVSPLTRSFIESADESFVGE